MKQRKMASILASIAMVFSLMVPVKVKAIGDVAKIGDVGYATLQEAVDQAKDGDTIDLLQDVDLDNYASSLMIKNKTLTIEGNGRTIETANHRNAIVYFGGENADSQKQLTVNNVRIINTYNEARCIQTGGVILN